MPHTEPIHTYIHIQGAIFSTQTLSIVFKKIGCAQASVVLLIMVHSMQIYQV